MLCTGLQEGIAPKFQVLTFATTTSVSFSKLSTAEIEAYIATGVSAELCSWDYWATQTPVICRSAGCVGEAFGKAGAYGIQGAASVFVRELHGDYFNVMGFPLNSFAVHISDLIRENAL